MTRDEIRLAIRRHGPRRHGPYAVLRALGEYVDAAGQCFPSVTLLARESRLTARSVQTAISWLETNGWLAVQRNAGMPGKRGRGATNLYRLSLPKLHIAYGESVSDEAFSGETPSGENPSCGKTCGIPVNRGGKPVQSASLGAAFSPEKNSGASRKLRSKRLETTATAEAGAASPHRCDGEPFPAIASRRLQ